MTPVARRGPCSDIAVAVDPRRKTRIGGDQKRLAALDRAEHAANQVHVQFAGAPEPAALTAVMVDLPALGTATPVVVGGGVTTGGVTTGGVTTGGVTTGAGLMVNVRLPVAGVSPGNQ